MKQGVVICESTELVVVKKRLKRDHFKFKNGSRGRNYYECMLHVNCSCKRVRETIVNEGLEDLHIVREYGEHSEAIVEAIDIEEFGLSMARTVPHMSIMDTELFILGETIKHKGLSPEKAIELMPTTKQLYNLKQYEKRSNAGIEVNSSRSLQISLPMYVVNNAHT
jgi:hypothetical protein